VALHDDFSFPVPRGKVARTQKIRMNHPTSGYTGSPINPVPSELYVTSKQNDKMKKKQPGDPSILGEWKAYCTFCGSRVGQISERTDKKVNAIYDCPKCRRNYCDQCSYKKEIGGTWVQLCLRCDSKMKKVI